MRPNFSAVERHYKKSISSVYPNTCAIRLSMALIAADPTIEDDFRIYGKEIHERFLISGAQDLAACLRRKWGRPNQDWAGGSAGNPLGNGVICYMNIPTYAGQGHIGLWKDGAAYNNDAYWSANPIWFWRLN